MDDLKKIQKQIASQIISGKTEPDFFETVRRLEQLFPERPRTGYAKRSSDDAVNFGQIPVLYFPETKMNSLQESADGRLRLLVYFFGLCGINGPLPLAYTKLVFQRTNHHYDRAMQRFLDIINHTFLRLYYRARADNSPSICFDRPEENQNGNILKVLLAQVDGIAEAEKQKYALMSESRYFYDPTRSSAGLYSVISDLLHIPVKIEERITEFYEIPRQYHSRLGVKDNAILGRNAQIGKCFISNTKKIRIYFGVLDFRQYLPLLPGADIFYRISSVIARYVNCPLEYDFVFLLRRETLPRARLNGSVALGQSAWLGQPSDSEIQVKIEASRIFTELYQKKQQESAKWECR